MSLLDQLPEPARTALAAMVADPTRTLVATDFDGTLSPLTDDPETAFADPDAVAGLAALAGAGMHVAIVTGRPVRTAVRLGRLTEQPALGNLVVLGQYGAERWDAATGEVRVPDPPAAVREFRRRVPGVIADAGWPDLYLEDKGLAVGVHTRRAADPEAALAAISGPVAALAAELGLRVEPGHLIVEVREPGVDKGAAIRTLVTETAARHLLFCGDDLGDLPAFAEVTRFRAAGGTGVGIAVAADLGHEVARRADAVLPDVASVARLFGDLAGRH